MIEQRKVIFGSINDHPLGIITEEMDEIYKTYYYPLLKALYSFPQIHIVLFFSGRVMEWIKHNKGEFFDVLSEMTKRKQIEILGGGFYSPMMNLISQQDSVGQIEMYTTYLRRHFGRRSRGSWITEQIWEPNMPSILRSAGIEYSFLSDYHYWKAGFEERDFFTPCITEDHGKCINIFPISHNFYHNFWDMSTDEIKNLIMTSQLYDENQIIGLLHKFPNQKSHFTKVESQIHNILSVLKDLSQENSIKTTLPSPYLRKSQRYCRGYFPVTSFDEMQSYTSMMQFEEYLHNKGTITSGVGRTGYYFGSFFRQNLSRYTEVNFMYSKMLFVYSLTNQVRGDPQRRRTAKEELWKGQLHISFWHGERGGVYINNYRKYIYSSLIQSEKLTREQGIFAPAVITLDFDMDGLNEYLYQGNLINVYVHRLGGTIFELDYLPSPWNYLDTMGRYPEAYHDSEQELKGYDTYPRRAFVDHFLEESTTMEQFITMAFDEELPLSQTLYTVDNTRSLKSKTEIQLSVNCEFNNRGEKLKLNKIYTIERRSISVQYRILNTGNLPIEKKFASEINISFLSSDIKHLELHTIRGKNKKTAIEPSATEIKELSSISFIDHFNKARIEIDFHDAIDCWSFPLETEHIDRNKWRQTYQGSTILPSWNINLAPQEEFTCTMTLNIRTLR